MVRLSKIYTRTGDKGKTRLVGGQKVDKDSCRLEAYGTVDELNAVLGMVGASVASHGPDAATREEVEGFLRQTQNDLFDLGSDLATELADRWEGQPLISADDTTRLEHCIDRWNEELEPLDSFVLPGGNEVAAALHLARTVCRRAERIVVTLARDEAIGDDVLPFINRLSDALFVLSRWYIHRCGDSELLWQK